MLEVRDLHVRYGHVHALRGANLSASRGQVLGIIGPNGAGKSTLLKAIAGLSRASSGRVSIDDSVVAGSPPQVLAQGVALVPQGRRLFNSMTVRENVLMGAYLRKDTSQVRADLDTWVSFFPEITAKLEARAGSLSGGQQQIVALVRGLMSAPQYLMLDEPSMGVAPIVVRRIGEEIRRLAEDTGLGILLVEQNVRLALDASDDVVVLSQGRDVHRAPPSELRDPEVLSRLFFGVNSTV